MTMKKVGEGKTVLALIGYAMGFFVWLLQHSIDASEFQKLVKILSPTN